MFAALLLLFVGIPITDQTVIAKCGTCHAVDQQSNMQRVSYARATPEGWQAVLKRMLRTGRVTMTQVEARDVLKYLSDTHGLLPQESKPVMYEAERRVHDETGSANEKLLETCAKCHTLGRVLSWRRSADEWKTFTSEHAERYRFKISDDLLKLISEAAPLEPPQGMPSEKTPELSGRWLVTAYMGGRGNFCGDLIITASSSPGEFFTRVTLRSIHDGSIVERSGRMAVYAGHEWRGRSQGTSKSGSSPDDPLSEARETLWIAPDGAHMEGRWFWGQYKEFGFDVAIQRAGGSTLLAVDVSSLKAGSAGNRVRLVGDQFPNRVTREDITVGAGVRVQRIISNSASEIVTELDVSADALPGRRDITLGSLRLPAAIAIYDRIDYIRVMPDAAMAAFGNETHVRGFQQFEAIAYQRGPDGRLHTADDLELGPVKAEWSMEVFYETDTSQREKVGSISQNGFFTPASQDTGANYDVWVIATAKEMTGKSYVVVTVPTYKLEGRTYVRDLDRWVEEP